MKIAAALAALAALLATPAALAEPDDPLIGSGRGLDHVLVWSRDVDTITSVLAVKLGFQVRPGGDFGDGVANRLVRFRDQSFLELLYFTRGEAELGADVREAFASAARGPHAGSFALEVGDVDATARFLRSRRWTLEPDSPMTYDPDGAGPLPAQESSWRTVGFPSPPLSAADLFFIRYAAMPSTELQRADRTVFSLHPNGAARLSSVWLLSADAEAESERMSRMGFISREPLELAELGVRGFRFAAGRGSVLVLEPIGVGAPADALAERGPHLFGIAFEVDDLDRAQRIVERGYGGSVPRYRGATAEAIAAPTRAELGFVVEFHGPSPNRPSQGEAR